MLFSFRYLRGYLKIKLWGFAPERFFNLCANKGILLWDIGKQEGYQTVCISLPQFYKLRPILRKTGCRVVILERYGLPFLLPYFWKRKIFFLCALVTVLFWLFSTAYVWEIKIDGNHQITEDMLERFLKEEAIGVGMKKSDVPIGELEKKLRAQYPIVTWVNVKFAGTKLVISMKESEVPIAVKLPAKEALEGRNLVAAADGVVTSMIVREGIPKVKTGDTVEKGALLVEGKIPIYDEDGTVREYRYVAADADIVIEHALLRTEKLDAVYIRKNYTGRSKKVYFLAFGTHVLKLPVPRPFFSYDEIERKNRPALFQKLAIPIYGGEILYREYQNAEHCYTTEEAKERLGEKLSLFLKRLQEKGVQIIAKDVKIEKESKNWSMEIALTVKSHAYKSVVLDRTGDMTEQNE